jgi:HSP20 family protein
MNRLFDEAFVMPRGGSFGNIPSVDVIENENEIVVKAELPGFKPDDVDIRVEGNVLTIRGEFKQENDNGKEGQYHVKERRSGTFTRSFTLPTNVDTSKANAEFENGVLYLTLPKLEEAKPKKISITAKNGNGNDQTVSTSANNQQTAASNR